MNKFLIVLAVLFIGRWSTGCQNPTDDVGADIPSRYSVSIPPIDEEAQKLANVLNGYK